MASLPRERVQKVNRPFTVTGVDLCGPFKVHYKKRGTRPTDVFLVVFVCFSTKAVHLELVENQSTEAFINALRRFVSRRGSPLQIWSDNGRNFIGASSELATQFKDEDKWESVYDWCRNEKGIEWKFIPPHAPTFGGLWEAAVKSAKYHLKRVVGMAHLTYEELYTVVTMTEAVLNSRPLVPLSVNPNDEQPLTPGHFLIGGPLTALPEPNVKDQPDNRLKRYHRVVALKQHFWQAWSRDYLQTLRQRTKCLDAKENLKVDDKVLIVENNVPSLMWKLGRVVAVHPGADGLVRVATIKTSSGEYRRPINKLCKLPVEEVKEDQVVLGAGMLQK